MKKRRRKALYSHALLIDAPEYHSYARAMGLLTWDTWEPDIRPCHERVRDFLCAYPPEDPVRFVGGSVEITAKGDLKPGSAKRRMARFLATDGRAGSLHELLARYGLKIDGAPTLQVRPFSPAPLRETAQRRNLKLRVLHGDVDVGPSNMDAKKAEYLDRHEKQRAAQEVRRALRQMTDELRTEAESKRRR